MHEFITQYCQLQSSVASRDNTSCEKLLRINTTLGEGLTINVCIDQRNMSLVIIMSIQGLFSTTDALHYGDKTWSVGAAVDGVDLVHCGKFEPFRPKGNLFLVLVLHSLSLFDISVARYTLCHSVVSVDSSGGQLSCFSQFGPADLSAHNPFEFFFHSLIMVRSGKRHHSRKRRDTSLHPPVALAVESAPSPVHEAGPSVGSSKKPNPISAFQTMHFKFQSNLHRPLITTHITLIISEEENLVSPLACIAPDPSPGNENSSGDDSMENWEKGKEDQEVFLKIPPPHEDPEPTAENRTDEAAAHVIFIPDSAPRGSESLKKSDTAQPEKKDNEPTEEN